MASPASTHARRTSASAILAVVALVSSTVPSAIADGATVTHGDFHPFAAGAALDINGHAQMVRTADGKTIVSIHVEGLAAETAYGSHVHKLPCGTSDADGHYKFDPLGPAAPPNEIWPGFTTNGAGIGNGNATADASAGPEAVSVVVHAPGGGKIACADLH